MTNTQLALSAVASSLIELTNLREEALFDTQARSTYDRLRKFLNEARDLLREPEPKADEPAQAP